MSEYIYTTNGEVVQNMTSEVFEPLQEIVRCRDCKYGIDSGEYCAEDCADSWDWRCVEPYGFCAWGERRQA